MREKHWLQLSVWRLWSLDLLSPLLPTIRLPSQRFVVFEVSSVPPAETREQVRTPPTRPGEGAYRGQTEETNSRLPLPAWPVSLSEHPSRRSA